MPKAEHVAHYTAAVDAWTGCRGCGDTTSPLTATRIVPADMAGDRADDPENNLPLCESCAIIATTNYHLRLLASVLLTGEYTPIPELEMFGFSGYPTGERSDSRHRPRPYELYPRDGITCKSCGTVTSLVPKVRDPLREKVNGVDVTVSDIETMYSSATPHGDREQYETGHIVPRHVGERLGIPLWFFNTAANLVLMCRPCNQGLYTTMPPLSVGIRWLIKSWTREGHVCPVSPDELWWEWMPTRRAS